MSDSAMIVSSHEVTEEEFHSLINSLGGDLIRPFRGSVACDESTVWVGLIYEDEFRDFYEENLLDWEAYLRGAPKAIIEMRLDHAPKARDLCLEVASEFGKRWPSLLVDVDGVDVPYCVLAERLRKEK